MAHCLTEFSEAVRRGSATRNARTRPTLSLAVASEKDGATPEDLTKSALERVSKGRKIGAIGIHVSRGITSHGFAFNVTTDLRDFGLINPCGITDRPVTSLEKEIADPKHLPSLEDVASRAAEQFGAVFDQRVAALKSLGELAAQSREFPAEDTPLRIPPEVERLRGREGRTEKA